MHSPKREKDGKKPRPDSLKMFRFPRSLVSSQFRSALRYRAPSSLSFFSTQKPEGIGSGPPKPKFKDKLGGTQADSKLKENEEKQINEPTTEKVFGAEDAGTEADSTLKQAMKGERAEVPSTGEGGAEANPELIDKFMAPSHLLAAHHHHGRLHAHKRAKGKEEEGKKKGEGTDDAVLKQMGQLLENQQQLLEAEKNEREKDREERAEEKEKEREEEKKESKKQPWLGIIAGAFGGGGLLTWFIQYMLQTFDLKKRVELAMTHPSEEQMIKYLNSPFNADLPPTYIERPEDEAHVSELVNRDLHCSILVMSGPPRCGKSTVLKRVINGRKHTILIELRHVKPEKRKETFVYELCKSVGLTSASQRAWAAQFDEKDRDHKLLDTYDTVLNLLRQVFKDLRGKTEEIPALIIDDAQYLIDLKNTDQVGHGMVQSILNLGIFLTATDQTANFLIVSSDTYCKNYLKDNFQGVRDGRLVERPMIGEAPWRTVRAYLKSRKPDLPEDKMRMIYNHLGGKFADLAAVDLHNPERWISIEEESEIAKIKRLLDEVPEGYTHAQLIHIIHLLCARQLEQQEYQEARLEKRQRAQERLLERLRRHQLDAQDAGRVLMNANEEVVPLLNLSLARHIRHIEAETRHNHEEENKWKSRKPKETEKEEPSQGIGIPEGSFYDSTLPSTVAYNNPGVSQSLYTSRQDSPTVEDKYSPMSARGLGFVSLMEVISVLPECVIERLVRVRILNKRADLDVELKQHGATREGGAYVTAYSSLTLSAMKFIESQLGLTLFVRERGSNQEPMRILLKNLTVSGLKREIERAIRHREHQEELSLSAERLPETVAAMEMEGEMDEEEEEALSVWAAGDRALQHGFAHLPHEHALPPQNNEKKQHAHLFAPAIAPEITIPALPAVQGVAKPQRIVRVSLPGKCQLEHTEDLLLLNNGTMVEYEMGCVHDHQQPAAL